MEVIEIDMDELVHAYIEDLYKVAYTYVKNPQMAEDIVQDVLLKAYEKQNQFRGEANYKTYLIRMVINRSHDVLRSWSYRNYQLTNTFTQFFAPHATEDAVIQKNEEEQLAKYVLALKPKYREVIYLHYYLDYSVKEIALLLRIAENTIKTRLARARKLLKGQLEEVIGDGRAIQKEL